MKKAWRVIYSVGGALLLLVSVIVLLAAITGIIYLIWWGASSASHALHISDNFWAALFLGFFGFIVLAGVVFHVVETAQAIYRIGFKKTVRRIWRDTRA